MYIEFVCNLLLQAEVSGEQKEAGKISDREERQRPEGGQERM